MSLDSIVAAMTAAFGALASDVDAARVDVAAFAPSPAGLRALDDHLASRAALAGHALSRADAACYASVVDALNASPEALTHARRWAAHVSARGDAARAGAATARTLEGAAAPTFERPAATANAEDASASEDGKKKKEKEESEEGERGKGGDGVDETRGRVDAGRTRRPSDEGVGTPGRGEIVVREHRSRGERRATDLQWVARV